MRPDRLHRWVGRFLPREHRESLLGDFMEEWEDRRSRSGAPRAWGAYLMDVGRSVAALRAAEAGRLVRRSRADLRRALRTILRRPGLSLAVVTSLGLGIGASGAAFSLVDSVLLKPLPFPEPHELVRVVAEDPETGREEAELSFPLIREVARIDGPLRVAAVGRVRLVVAGEDGATRLRAEAVTDGYFELLGLEAARGRLPRADAGGPELAVSHRVWLDRYGGAPNVVGRVERTANASYEIVGVLPPGFLGTTEEDVVDVWVPLVSWARLETDGGEAGLLENPDRSWLRTVARIRGEVDPSAVRSGLDRAAAGIEPLLTNADAPELRTRPLDERWRSTARSGLLLLLGGTLGVLLIGTFNAVSLLLARLAQRRSELATRRALGARGWDLLGTVASEALVLAGAGGVLGLLRAFGLLELLSSLVLTGLGDVTLPGWVEIEVSSMGVGFSLVATAGVAAVSAVLPALGVPSLLERSSMAGGARGGAASQSRVAEALTVAEIGTATLLLVSAGLLLRSWAHLQDTDPGFAVERLAKVQVTADGPAYESREARESYHRRVLAAIRELPGVEAAGIVSPSLPPLSLWSVELEVEGSGAREWEALAADYHLVSPGVLELMEIELLEGRTFSELDREDATEVAVVSESLARRIAPGQSPVGRRIRIAGPTERAEWLTVVGMVRDVAWEGPRAAPAVPVDLYVPVAYDPPSFFGVAARTAGPASSLLAPMRRSVGRLDPQVPVHWVETMEASLEGQTVGIRRQGGAVAVFAGIAVVMAVIGVYGVLSHAVSRRYGEFGLRAALGATASRIAGRIMARAAVLVTLGVGAGIAGSVVAGRLLAATLYGVRPTDPVTLTAVASIILLAGIAASLLPAVRAARSDPVGLLRAE